MSPPNPCARSVYQPPQSTLVRLEEAAIEFSLPVQFLQTLIRRGSVPGDRQGESSFIHRDELAQWVERFSRPTGTDHPSLVHSVRTREAYSTFLPTLECTHMVTLTFRMEVAIQMAQDFLGKMYRRFLHLLLGGDYSHRKDQQPFAIAFGEHGSDSVTGRKISRARSSEATSKKKKVTFGNNHFFHWHGLLKLTKKHVEKLSRKCINNEFLSSIWKKINSRCSEIFVERIENQSEAAGYITKSLASLSDVMIFPAD